MLGPPSVRLKSVKAKNNKLIVKIEVSTEITRFFLEHTFLAEYNINIENVSESILCIPALSTILPVAWAVGADVYVNEADETYLLAMAEVRDQLKQWYPNLSCSTEIHAKKVVRSRFNNQVHGLLFSGGVDSMFSCARLKDKNPTLISVCGGDIPYTADHFWAKVKSWLLNFASDQGLKIQFIKTNMLDIINRKYLQSKFGIETWWGNIGHGLMLLSLCAPLTSKEIGSIVIAATHTSEFRHPWGSHPLLDSKISWSDVNVIHYGYDFSRQEKIKYLIRNYPSYLKYLRVCYLQHLDYNCGHCEKCMRTVTGLLLENKDPRECNFEIDNAVLDLVKKSFIRRMLPLGEDERFMWQDIQKHIPLQMEDGKYGQRRFFGWLKEFDFKNYQRVKLAELMFFSTYFFRYKSISDMARHVRGKVKEIIKSISTSNRK